MLGRYRAWHAVIAMLLLATTHAMAAGPVGHYIMGKQIISNIQSGRCDVAPELKMILQNPDARRAFEGGAVGPDICEAKSHYNNTAALAEKMLKDAQANYRAAAGRKDEEAFSKARLDLAFAYGWYTHCAEDLNVHPKVNAMAGDTFRDCTTAQKGIHAAQEAQLTAYLKSVTGASKYDVYVPFDFLSKHVGVAADELRASEAKLRAKVVAELFAASKVKMTDKIRQSWRAAVNGSMRDSEQFLKNPGAMQNWDLDCGRMSTTEFDELRRLAIQANGGTLPSNWGKSYPIWFEKTRGMSPAQKLETLKALIGGKTASAPVKTVAKKPAAKTKPSYAWVLTETIEFNPTVGRPEPSYTIAGGSGSYNLKWKSQGCYADGCPGEAFGLQFTWNQPPKIIKSNQKIAMTITGSVTENTMKHYSCNGSMDVFFDRPDIDPGFYGGGPGLGGMKFGWNTDKSGASVTKTIEGSPGRGYESAGKMALIIALYNGRSAGTKYIYQWKLVNN